MSNTTKDVSVTRFEEALDRIDQLVTSKRGKPLMDVEIVILKGIWNKQSYSQMAENSPYSVNYLQRTAAPRLYEELTKTIGEGEMNKNTLGEFLEKLTGTYDKNNVYLNFLNKVRGSIPPDISNFYGRGAEKKELKTLLSDNRCVYTIGVAGIGKSLLAAEVMADLSLKEKKRFDYFIWKSLAYKSRQLGDLLGELLFLIDPGKLVHLPDDTQSRISILMRLIGKKRYLVVLDDFFTTNENNSNSDYNSFLQRLVEEKHQSCFLFTSRILPGTIVNQLIQAQRPINFFRVEGLDTPAGIQLLFEQGFKDSDKSYELIQKYRGNPSELKAVVDRIRNVFGSEETFFQNPTTLISHKFESMLDEMFTQRLNEVQKQILVYITKISDESNSTQMTKLLADVKNNIGITSTSEIIKSIEILEQCSLIEKKQSQDRETSFTIQPIVKKYIKTNFLN